MVADIGLKFVGRQGFDSGHHPWSSLVLLFSIVHLTLRRHVMGGIPPHQISREGL